MCRHARLVALGLMPFSFTAPPARAAGVVTPSPDISSDTSTARPVPASVTPSDVTTLPAVNVSARGNGEDASGGSRPVVDPNLPASTETLTRSQFENWNVVNTEDVLKYMPNLAVRKRFIGDLNSIVAVRGTSNTQSVRGLV